MKGAPLSRSECLCRLELDDTASIPEIRRAYRRLVLEHHPDQNGGSEESSQRFMVLVAAYRELMRQEIERLKAKARPPVVSPGEMALAQGWSASQAYASPQERRGHTGGVLWLSARITFMLGAAMVLGAGLVVLCSELHSDEESLLSRYSNSESANASERAFMDLAVTSGFWLWALACVLACTSRLSSWITRGRLGRGITDRISDRLHGNPKQRARLRLHFSPLNARAVKWASMVLLGLLALLIAVPLLDWPPKERNEAPPSSLGKPEQLPPVSSSVLKSERRSPAAPSSSAESWRALQAAPGTSLKQESESSDSIFRPITPPSLRSLGLEFGPASRVPTRPVPGA